MPFTENNGLKIYYEFAGDEAKPPLLMLHGNGNCLKNWYDLGYVDHLKPHVRLIMMDCRGYGKSDKPHDISMYNPKMITSDCLAVLDAVGVKSCHVHGGSRGADIALLLAKMHPNRFLSYIINDAKIYDFSARKEFLSRLKQLENEGMKSVTENLEEWLGRRFPNSIRDDYINNDIQAMIAATSMIYPHLGDIFADFKKPCCLIASHSEPWNLGTLEPWKSQMAQFAKKNSHCMLHRFNEITHAELYWSSDIVAPLIIDFIKSF